MGVKEILERLGMNVRSVVMVPALFLALLPRAAWAHGEGVLKVGVNSVAAGSMLAIEGSSFEKGTRLRLVLVGALEEYALQEVTTDTVGAFGTQVRLPGGARPGQYRLVAVAPDGDRVASVDLAVTVAMAGDGGQAVQEGHGAGPGEGGELMVRAGEMPMERSWSAAEWGVIGLLIGLAGGAGVALLLRREV